MPKPRFPYVEQNPNRHGRTRYYFRKARTDARVRLPDAYGSAEFLAAYQACLAGQPLPALPGRGPAAYKVSRGSLGWLIKLYLKTPHFQAVYQSEATRRPILNMLERLAEEKGAVDIEDIDRAAIAASVEARRATPHMANRWLTNVSKMFAWAAEEILPGETAPIVSENPCARVKKLVVPKLGEDEEEGHQTWTNEDLAQFEAAYPHGTRERLVYEVLLCTGARVGDAARIGRQHVRADGVLRFKTEKTGTWVTQTVLPRLKHALEAGPKGNPEVLAWITAARGNAMEKDHLGTWFSGQCRAIGLKDRSAHGIRKAAARRYAEAGANEMDLMAIFGWTTSAMAQKYIRMFNREKVAIRAMKDYADSPTLGLGGGTAL